MIPDHEKQAAEQKVQDDQEEQDNYYFNEHAGGHGNDLFA